MIKHLLPFFFAILVSTIAIGQQFDQVSLENYIRKELVYPEDALSKGIRGIVYIEFKVNNFGEILQDEIRLFCSLSPSCDQEALRVVKSYANKNSSTTPNKLFIRSYIIPIRFIQNAYAYDEPSHYLELPVITTIQAKTVTAKKATWSVYGKKGLESVVGEVAVGDTVLVSGWSAWCYFIQTKEVTGFVSYKSLDINEAMQSISELVNERSPVLQHIEEEEKAKEELVIPKDTVGNFSTETLYLALTSNKKTVYEGECAVVSLTFNVSNDNRIPIQFYELGKQLYPIRNSALNQPNSFIVDNNLQNIEGKGVRINDKEYTVYPIYERAYCPTSLEPPNFPVIKLKMLFGDSYKKMDKIGEFHSLPLSIKVKPLPVDGITNYNKYKMVGNFSLDEKVKEQTVLVGKPFTFQVSIKGTGLIFPIEPPKFKGSPLKITLHNIDSKDTIINETLQSSRTFTYQATSLDTGVLNFSNYVNFSFFNPSTQKKETLTSAFRLISKEAGISKKSFTEHSESKKANRFLIAMDLSESMMIEDYTPNRLEVVKAGLKLFLKNRTQCDINLMSFAGSSTLITPGFGALCYTNEDIDPITFSSHKGTAIGDAIWFSRLTLAESGAKKIVIIGDGDNTAGVISPVYAAELAKQENIQVYTIGIGNSGLVPFGRDFFGAPHMIEDTFSEKDLKKIASVTGGKYFHAKTAEEISKILNEIFETK